MYACIVCQSVWNEPFSSGLDLKLKVQLYRRPLREILDLLLDGMVTVGFYIKYSIEYGPFHDVL